MDKFYTIIQIITGVNFVFILSNFLHKTIDELFDVKSHLNANNKRYANKWLLNAETVSSLTFHNERGENNGEAVQKLSNDYQRIASTWTSWCNWLIGFNDRVSQKLGFQALFLVGSMYCIADLLFMALVCKHPDSTMCTVQSLGFNVLFIFVLAKVIYRILYEKINNVKEENLQRSFWFFCLSVVMLIVLWLLPETLFDLLLKVESFNIPRINKTISVVLPFMPCFLSVLYIFVVELVNKAAYGIAYVYCTACAIRPERERKKLAEIHKTFNSSDNPAYG